MNKYLPRLVDKLIKEDLRLYGAVSIEGPKWCGKSTTASRFAKSKLELQNPDTRQKTSLSPSISPAYCSAVTSLA